MNTGNDMATEPIRSALFSSAHFSSVQQCIKEILEDCCRQWAVTLSLLCCTFCKQRQARENGSLTRFIILRQEFKLWLIPLEWDWSAFIILIHSWKHCTVFLFIVTVCQRRCGSNWNIIPELAVEKPLLMERREKRLAYFKLKWKGQYGQDRGFSGFTVQWWCLKARSFSNVGGMVVPSIFAIVLSLALCTCQHHCSLSQDKCWFCFI